MEKSPKVQALCLAITGPLPLLYVHAPFVRTLRSVSHDDYGPGDAQHRPRPQRRRGEARLGDLERDSSYQHSFAHSGIEQWPTA